MAGQLGLGSILVLLLLKGPGMALTIGSGGYGLIVSAMLANVLFYPVQRGLTHGRRYSTLYESQVERREDSPLHRGVLVRRAIELMESSELESSEIRLPRLMQLLRYGEPIPITGTEGLLVEVTVEPGSALAGSCVADTVGAVEGVTAIAVLRGQEILVARGPTRFAAGDRLLAAVTGRQAHEEIGALSRAGGFTAGENVDRSAPPSHKSAFRGPM